MGRTATLLVIPTLLVLLAGGAWLCTNRDVVVADPTTAWRQAPPEGGLPDLQAGQDEVSERTVAPAEDAMVPAVPGGAGPRTKHARRPLRLYCSPTAHQILQAAIERPFELRHASVDLVLHRETSRTCIGHVVMGNAAAAVVTSPLSDNEKDHGLTTVTLGYRIVVAVTHLDNPVVTLFPSQLEKILDGRIASWAALGWEGHQIQPVFQAPDPGPADAASAMLRMTGKAADIAKLVSGEEEVLAFVASEPRALGLVSLAAFAQHKGVHALEINAVRPSVQNCRRGAYPLARVLRLVHRTEPTADLAALLRFLARPETRELLAAHVTL